MIRWLFERFAANPDRAAMVWRDQDYSFAWLLERTRQWEMELESGSITRRSVVAVEGDYSPQSAALLLALVERSAIVVPLSSAVEASKAKYKTVAEVQATVRFSADENWRIERSTIEVVHPLLRSLMTAGRPGLVLFSSGSTGEPKAVLHDFGILLEKFQLLRQSFRTLAFLLLDHIGGLNTLFYVLSNLGTVISVGRRTPDAVCAAIERHRVELLPTTPTFLNLLLISEAHRRHDLSSLKQITYGTEVMPQATLRRIHELFPHVRLLQTYGMSELGILRSKSRESDSLWLKVGGEGFETRVDQGILHVRARSAMLGYLNAPNPFDASGWLNTGDAVEVDGEYIRFLGRRSDVINVGGEKVYPTEVENAILNLDNVADVTVVGEPNPLTGQIVAAHLCLKDPEPAASVRTRIREHCRRHLASYKVPVRIEILDEARYTERFKKLRRV